MHVQELLILFLGLYWVAIREATHFPQWAVFFHKKTVFFLKVGLKKMGFIKKISIFNGKKYLKKIKNNF